MLKAKTTGAVILLLAISSLGGFFWAGLDRSLVNVGIEEGYVPVAINGDKWAGEKIIWQRPGFMTFVVLKDGVYYDYTVQVRPKEEQYVTLSSDTLSQVSTYKE